MIKKIFFSLIFLCCLFVFSTARADEKKEEILFYKIDATLNKDSSLDVKETITVRALGQFIARGIYRDFALLHAGDKTPVSISSATRNGQPISFSVENYSNIKRVYLGDMTKYISPGVYEYEIIYKYYNIIRQNNEKTKDEFYYNLIGGGWIFNILAVEAVVNLPDGLKLIENPKVFTGKYSLKNQNAVVRQNGNQIFIRMPNGLKKREAMTIRAVSNSGFFQIPEKSLFLNKRVNNLFVIFVVFVFWLVLYYAYSSWKEYGKDGIKKPVFPRYNVPKFNSLGALSLLWRFHHSSVNALNLVIPHFAHLSQRGLLTVEVAKRKIFLKKNKNITPENSDERFFLETAEDSYILDKSKYNPLFADYVKDYEAYAKSEIDSLFKRNIKQLVIFNLLMFLFCVGFFLLCFKSFSNIVPAIVLSGCVPVISNIILMLFKREKGWVGRLFGYIFVLGFLAFWFCVFLCGVFYNLIGIDNFDELFKPVLNFKPFFFVFLFASFGAFYKYIIVRVYDKGLFLIEHLEGIEMFLKGTDDLKYKTPEQAEMDKLLPYAILLGMQEQWSQKMKSYFNFTPPKDDAFRNKVFFSTISSTLYSASTKPSNSGSGGGSGFSGGGCSGGGTSGF